MRGWSSEVPDSKNGSVERTDEQTSARQLYNQTLTLCWATASIIVPECRRINLIQPWHQMKFAGVDSAACSEIEKGLVVLRTAQEWELLSLTRGGGSSRLLAVVIKIRYGESIEGLPISF